MVVLGAAWGLPPLVAPGEGGAELCEPCWCWQGRVNKFLKQILIRAEEGYTSRALFIGTYRYYGGTTLVFFVTSYQILKHCYF